ncbi:hypothetical protein [Maritimibacter sp. 55A14]|uniref:hypothetical protein n=1 Tax=Maritimibacter sp. 55A14 TaxID=2174844 RepID=UPI0011B2853A|nr:hypothetical protein [Maritimibacter sp. 55A14]
MKSPPRRGWFRTAALLSVAVLVCLGALIVNSGPLYYFDSGSYFKQGDAALSLILPAEHAEGAGAGAGGRIEDDDTVVGSRSMVYALIVAALWRLDALSGLAILHLGAVLLAAWLAARAASHHFAAPPGRAALVAVPLLAGALGALPFYIAYVMPDIFAPVLILVFAALAAMSRQMGPLEILAALALGSLAVVTHPSHLAIAGLMVPLVLLGALIQSRRRWWLPPLLVLLVFLAGVAEREVFRIAAKTVAHKEVTYTPHITARLIVDGPGYAYLEDHCPDPALATCRLYEALSWSDDPYRLTVSHIIFETSPELGSFRLLPPEDRQRVAAAQREFFFDVLAARPFDIGLAFAKNTLLQFLFYDIGMTIPTDGVMESVRNQTRMPGLEGGALAESRGWISGVMQVQSVVYAISFAAVVVLLLWPGRLPGPVRAFGVFLLLGLGVNAFVCGAVSQPADRYGARVIWLLPYAAAFLALCFHAARDAAPNLSGGSR